MRKVLFLCAMLGFGAILALVGCDTGQTNEGANAVLKYKEVTLDTQLIEKASLLRNKNQIIFANADEFELLKPQYEFISEEKPLLHFANEEEFNQTVNALRTVSILEKTPLKVNEALKEYVTYEEPVLSIAELSLADAQGRIAIGDKLYDMVGKKTEVTDIKTGKFIEELTPEVPQWVYTTRSRQGGIANKTMSTSLYCSTSENDGNNNSVDDDCGEYSSLPTVMLANNGLYYQIKALAHHDAWQVTFGTRTYVNNLLVLRVNGTGSYQEFDGSTSHLFDNTYGITNFQSEAKISYNKGGSCGKVTTATYNASSSGIGEYAPSRCANTDPLKSTHTLSINGVKIIDAVEVPKDSRTIL